MLVISLALALGAFQEPTTPGQVGSSASEPLRRIIELEVEGECTTVEHIVEHRGSISIWASSLDFDLRLKVQVEGRKEIEEDDNSGGGTTAWLRVLVEPGDAIVIQVLGTENPGQAELHIVTAPETLETHAGSARAAYELLVIDLFKSNGFLAEARKELSALIEGLIALPGGNSSFELAHAYWKAGISAYGLSDPSLANKAWEACHGARQRLLPPDHPDLLMAKGNLAMSLQALGDLEGALALEKTVHAARVRLLPPDHLDLLTAKSNLATTVQALGDLEGALALEEAVHAAMQRLLPPDHSELLKVKLNLATTLQALGDLEGALALEEAVYAAWQRLLPPDHLHLLVAKQNLANTLKNLGNHEDALALSEAVHAARERLLPADHPDLLKAKQNLATMLLCTGDLEGALALEEVSLAAWERLLPADHPDLLKAKQNMAAALFEFGDLQGALELFEAVHATRERLLPADHPYLLLGKQSQALVLGALGDLEGAQVALLSMANSLTKVAAGAVVAAPRVARAIGRDAVQRLSQARFLSEFGGREIAEASFKVLETVRYAVSSPLGSETLQVEGADEVWTNLNRAKRDLDRLVSNGFEVPAAEDASEDELQAMREEASRIWREQVQAAALRRDGAQKKLLARVEDKFVVSITAKAVSAALPENHAAVGITKLDHYDWDDLNNCRVFQGQHYLAFVVLPGDELREVDLGAADQMDELIEAWREGLGAPTERGMGRVVGGGTSETEAGRALRRKLIDPLIVAAGNPKPGFTLHICLDAGLFTLPVDALPLDVLPEGTALDLMGDPVQVDVPRLGDKYRLRNETSMARLICPRPDPGTPPSVLVVGEVNFDEVDDESPVMGDSRSLRISKRGSWERLSATAAEVSELEFQAKHYKGVKAHVLRGDEVTHGALAQAVQGKRTVHLATHGWFMPETIKSMLDSEPNNGLDLLGSRRTITGFAPLELCGLVLSGANSAANEEERSARLLTAQELSSFDLSACDLAVLSACETNVGVTRAGQGIQSLQSALHTAGARTSITSLWQVPDWPTQSLMKRFYDNLWGEGMSKADALWAAKRSLREEGMPPKGWAGWVLTGDPD